MGTVANTTELQAEIEEARRELGQNMAAFVERADPKVLARNKLDDAKTRARQRSVPVVAIVTVATVILVAVRRYTRRRSR